jgi:hypothetical protein
MRIRGMHKVFWWESQKEIDQQEYINVGGRIMLRWILQKYDGVVLTGLIWLSIETYDGLCEHGNEPSGSIKVRTFLSS